jgi:tRNA U55 pseudouridine synthase TruB
MGEASSAVQGEALPAITETDVCGRLGTAWIPFDHVLRKVKKVEINSTDVKNIIHGKKEPLQKFSEQFTHEAVIATTFEGHLVATLSVEAQQGRDGLNIENHREYKKTVTIERVFLNHFKKVATAFA